MISSKQAYINKVKPAFLGSPEKMEGLVGFKTKANPHNKIIFHTKEQLGAFLDDRIDYDELELTPILKKDKWHELLGKHLGFPPTAISNFNYRLESALWLDMSYKGVTFGVSSDALEQAYNECVEMYGEAADEEVLVFLAGTRKYKKYSDFIKSNNIGKFSIPEEIVKPGVYSKFPENMGSANLCEPLISGRYVKAYYCLTAKDFILVYESSLNKDGRFAKTLQVALTAKEDKQREAAEFITSKINFDEFNKSIKIIEERFLKDRELTNAQNSKSGNTLISSSLF